jgi:hypothetical protein
MDTKKNIYLNIFLKIIFVNLGENFPIHDLLVEASIIINNYL